MTEPRQGHERSCLQLRRKSLAQLSAQLKQDNTFKGEAGIETENIKARTCLASGPILAVTEKKELLEEEGMLAGLACWLASFGSPNKEKKDMVLQIHIVVSNQII